MRQDIVEKMAFFYLCGKRDQNILAGNMKMTFFDFQRFDYLTRRLGFWEFNKKIWKDFSKEFKVQIDNLETNLKEEWQVVEEIEEQEKWWQELSENNKELLDLESDCC